MLTDTARIVRFWQAVETFNPRPLPRPDFRDNITDIRGGDPLPWEPGSRLAARQPAAGKAWRHQVFGGLFELTALRAALAAHYDSDDASGGRADTAGDLPTAIPSGQSALFACTVDSDGALTGHVAVSECARALGAIAAAAAGARAWLAAIAGPGGGADGDLKGRPLTAQDLRGFAADLARRLGVSALLAPAGLRVRSYQVPADAADPDSPDHLLASRFAGDLALVADALPGGAGPALADYLCGGEDINWSGRVDVRREPLQVREGCAPGRIPPGRWVADTGHALVRSQQFAVNEIMARLAPGPGLFTMHAPPGTGSTTVLRELVAAIVVERARRLATLATTSAAFGLPRTWRAGPTVHTVTAPAPALTGFEIVLTGQEHAGIGDIGHRWRDQAAELDYFAPAANLASGGDAWALISARLGDRSERLGFVERFWEGTVRGTDALFRTGESMPALLGRLAEREADWPAAVIRFSEAMAKVDSLSSERTVASASVARLFALEQALEEAYLVLESAQARCAELTGREVVTNRGLAEAEERRRASLARLEEHLTDRPGLRAGLRAGREWYTSRGTLRAGYDEALQLRDDALAQTQTVRTDLASARRTVTEAEEEVGRLTAEMASLQEPVAQVRRRWGNHVPDGPAQEETQDAALIERREKSAGWADEEFAAARTELFLAALALHKTLITAEADSVQRNLAALMDMLSGEGRPPPEVALAAWQSFFLLVPVVCTPLESVGSLFAGLGRGSLGWLLADRAEQAQPQQVLGALWRADRAVLAGDPLQAGPESPLPWPGQQALLEALEVDEEWAPARSCAQRVADRLARHGTWLPVEAPDGSGRLWVGTPLRVHRVSDRPILELCNEIAYDGLLVCGTPVRETFPGADAWYDVPGVEGAVGHRGAGQWIPAEGEVLLSLLTSLRAAGVPAAEIRVISPFPAVAAAAARVYCAAFGEVSADELRTRVGTVHTVKSGDVVIIVLGGGTPDARALASRSPNAANTAVGRARRRLYVIGDRETWASQPYFEVLARRLPDADPAPRSSAWVPRTNLAG